MSRRKVIRKQENSRMCIVCGLKNPGGLQAAFFELDNGELAATFTAREHHYSYPGRLHGGISAAALDEAIGRAILIRSKGETWGVTVEFTSRYKKQVPLDRPLMIVGRIVKEGSRFFEGTGELLLEDGTVAVEGKGKYLKMPLGRIMDPAMEGLDWRVVPSPDDPVEVETPDAPPAES